MATSRSARPGRSRKPKVAPAIAAAANSDVPETGTAPVAEQGAVPPAAPTGGPMAEGDGDVPMQSVESLPAYTFVPQPHTGQKDFMEIIWAMLFHLTGSQLVVGKGQLRDLQLPADRYEMLSDSARRFMMPVGGAQ